MEAMRRRELAWVTAASARAVAGAGRRVVMGLIGCGGRGRYVAKFMRGTPDVEFAAVCDVYARNAEAAREWAGPRARAFGDFRRLLELREIDAVLVATPDHWHAIPAVLACQAGKHVYLEKPLAYSIREGRAIVEAAARARRIVQPGTQHRSAPHFRQAAELVAGGALGQVRFVRVWNYSNVFPRGIGQEPDSEPPPGLDWDFYLGPAPKVPFNRKRFLSTYRSFRDYAGGTITDFGTHRFDTVHQIMGVDAPLSVSASGGRFSLRDAGDVPDILQATYEYPGFVMSYEACELNAHGLGGRTAGMQYYRARGAEDRPHGMAFYGTSGALFADRLGFEVYPEGERTARLQVNVADATEAHARNFIESVRGQARPAASVEMGHRATIIAHLGNIALATARKLRWDPAKEDFTAAPEASRLLSRPARKPWDIL